jgi:hypothetical protein
MRLASKRSWTWQNGSRIRIAEVAISRDYSVSDYKTYPPPGPRTGLQFSACLKLSFVTRSKNAKAKPSVAVD